MSFKEQITLKSHIFIKCLFFVCFYLFVSALKHPSDLGPKCVYLLLYEGIDYTDHMENLQMNRFGMPLNSNMPSLRSLTTLPKQ